MQKSQKVIECAKKYIIENYQNADLPEEMVSKAAGVSPISFSCLFKKVTGQTYISYLRKVRMNSAERMLCQTEEKTYVIAKQAELMIRTILAICLKNSMESHRAFIGKNREKSFLLIKNGRQKMNFW